MIDWFRVTPALLDWTLRGSGLGLAVDKDAKRPFGERQWALIQVLNVKSSGWDDYDMVTELDTSVHPNVNRTYARIQGQRTFTLRVNVESEDQDADGKAVNVLEALKAAWLLERQRAILTAVNVCCAGPPGDVVMQDDPMRDDRVVSVWSLDVEMNAGFTYVDRTVEVDYVSDVEGYARLPTDSEPVRVVP